MERLNQDDAAACSEYEAFVGTQENGTFLQSLKWAGVKKNWKNEVLLVRDEGKRLKGAMQVLIRRLPLLHAAFLYAPRGPVCDYDDMETLAALIAGADGLAREYHAYQFLCDPCIRDTDRARIARFQRLGLSFRANAPELSTIQVRQNYMLRLTGKTRETLFASFHRKWRYNIRLAERKGVECRVCGREAVPVFYGLMKETGKRDGFCVRGEAYFDRMLNALGDSCRLYLTYYEGVPLSGAIAVQYAGKTCYVYGASSSLHREVMPNYLMQWRMIEWALEAGCDWYDFQGIPFYQDETHPNYGVYRFKRGFHGEVVTYAGEFTRTYSKGLLRLVELARRTRRGPRPAEAEAPLERRPGAYEEPRSPRQAW